MKRHHQISIIFKSLAIVLLLLPLQSMQAQQVDKGDLKLDQKMHTVDALRHMSNQQKDLPQDFTLPSPAGDYLYLRAEGADGGKRYSITNDCLAEGGEGATIKAVFQIGTGARMIPPGSTLRFLVGLHGDNHKGSGFLGGGGGGGTGILFRAPNQEEWNLLMVAGGGGGGSAAPDRPNKASSGHPGVTTKDGDHGGGTDYGSGGTNGGNGGSSSERGGEGGGGLFGETPDLEIEGRPGWEGARYEISTYDSRTGTKTSEYKYDYTVAPTGGEGGVHNTDWINDLVGGGWGFGGGGSGLSGGGGGGGYSGGGGGDKVAFSASYGGGGGGSYISSYYAVPGSIQKIKNGSTRSPGNGFVEYGIFTDPWPHVGQIQVNRTNNITTLKMGGRSANGLLYHLQTMQSALKFQIEQPISNPITIPSQFGDFKLSFYDNASLTENLRLDYFLHIEMDGRWLAIGEYPEVVWKKASQTANVSCSVFTQSDLQYTLYNYRPESGATASTDQDGSIISSMVGNVTEAMGIPNTQVGKNATGVFSGLSPGIYRIEVAWPDAPDKVLWETTFLVFED